MSNRGSVGMKREAVGTPCPAPDRKSNFEVSTLRLSQVTGLSREQVSPRRDPYGRHCSPACSTRPCR
jgi:hypothetical protein